MLNRSDASECVTPGGNDEAYRIEKGEEEEDGKGAIEPESKPSITTVEDTQCQENIASDLTSNPNQYTPNISECHEGNVRDEGGGFSAKMPEEFPPGTERDKDPICESSPPSPIIIEELEDHHDRKKYLLSESDLRVDNEVDTY
jgi:hypothetical protein